MKIRSTGVLCLAALFAGMVALPAKREPVVSLPQGKLQGRFWPDGGGAFFKGVPFAQPPVGNLRWRAPQPPKPWTGVRQAAAFAPACAQEYAGAWNAHDANTGSEDCLYLNIWTPEWPIQRKYPVMVWIHGGGNEGGSAATNFFDGEPLARHGVVLVTIQYRLGLFGFLALPGLTKESAHHTSGDYGIMDQVAALQWVHDNIAKFGGDPDQVTVFGQSAGSLDTGILQTSPLARGLFARAIQESGPVGLGGRALPTLAESERNGEKLIASLNPPSADPIAYLRGLSTARIIKAEPPYLEGNIGPSVDPYVIPRDPAQVFAENQEISVPLMIGNNAREFTLPGGPAALKQAIEKFFGSYAPQALRFYGLAGGPPASTYPPYGDANAQFDTDITFRCPTVDVANQHSRIAATYEYEFSHALPGLLANGATHSSELGYVFGTFGMGKPSAFGRQLSADMEGYWTNFAKTGNPNGGSLLLWPKHDAASQKYMEFMQNGLVVKQNLRPDVCSLYNKAVAQR